MIPNALSILRIFLVVPVIILFIFDFYILSAVFFLFSAFTDYLDGVLARKLNQESDAGALLDLVADKICVATILIFLLFFLEDVLLLFPVMLIILREIIISHLRIFYLSKIKDLNEIKADTMGKIKTAIQMISISFLIISPLNNNFFIIGVFLLYISALISLISLKAYFTKWEK